MKIKIGHKQITVPAFIANSTDENKKEFHSFLKLALAFQSLKTQDRIYEEQKQAEAFNNMIDNPMDIPNPFKDLLGGFRRS